MNAVKDEYVSNLGLNVFSREIIRDSGDASIHTVNTREAAIKLYSIFPYQHIVSNTKNVMADYK